MMGRRVLPVLVGLWACSALGQVTATQVTASESILLSDAGVLSARAFWVTGGTSAQYAMANAGGSIQVFTANGTALPGLSPGAGGGFLSFAVATVPIGAATTTTLVAATEFGSSACSTAVCLRVYFWDPVGNFQETLVSPINTTTLSATAMAIDATSSPVNIYYATANPTTLYEQAISISASNGAVTVGALNSRFLNAQLGLNNVKGLAVDTNTDITLFLSDNQNTLYSFTLDLPTLDGGVFKQTDAGFSQLDGISFFNNGAASTLVGGGVANGVYVFNPYTPTTNFVVQQLIVLAQDGGATLPAAASLDKTGNIMLVTEDINAGIGPWLHIVTADAGPPVNPDAGSDAGVPDAGSDAGSVPTIPSIAPGPGAAPGPANSCNCSSAGSAPVLLVLLLPLLVPRRRRSR